MAYKTVTKKTAVKKSVKSPQDYKKIKKFSEDLELDLQNIQKKLKAFFHDPFIYSPRPPRPRK